MSREYLHTRRVPPRAGLQLIHAGVAGGLLAMLAAGVGTLPSTVRPSVNRAAAACVTDAVAQGNRAS